MKPAKQERLPQLDIFRALAIMGVLHVHASSFAAGEQALNSPYYYWINGMNIFFKFGTPSFIFLSSFVLFYNYYGRPLTRSLITNFYRRRMTYILLPYLFASICYYAFKLYTNGTLMLHPMDNLTRFLRALATGNAYAHLYFVFISIQFYVLFPLVLRLLQRYRQLNRWLIPIGLALQWIFIIWNKYQLHVPEKGSLAISYFGYYLMGAYIAIYFEDVKKWLQAPWPQLPRRQKALTVLLIGSWLIAAFVHMQLWYEGRHNGVWTNSLWYELLWNVHTMLSALVLLYLAFLIYRKGSRSIVALLTRLGELSFAIYLLHPFLLALYRRFRYNISPESLTYILFIYGGLVVALGGSWLIVQFAFRRIRPSWMVLGSVPSSLAPKAKQRVRRIPEDSTNAKLRG